MSLLLEKSKPSSYSLLQEDLTSETHEYSEIISFLEQIKKFQIPDIIDTPDSLSLFDLRSDQPSLANSSN